MHRLCSTLSGYSVGYTQTKSIGNPSQLVFLHADGTVLRERVLPDAATDIVETHGMWVTGCRNDWVYGYSVDGERVWQWRMPPDQSGYWDGSRMGPAEGSRYSGRHCRDLWRTGVAPEQ
jgi:hypothetical protein